MILRDAGSREDVHVGRSTCAYLLLQQKEVIQQDTAHCDCLTQPENANQICRSMAL